MYFERLVTPYLMQLGGVVRTQSFNYDNDCSTSSVTPALLCTFTTAAMAPRAGVFIVAYAGAAYSVASAISYLRLWCDGVAFGNYIYINNPNWVGVSLIGRVAVAAGRHTLALYGHVVSSTMHTGYYQRIEVFFHDLEGETL
jgi:hypothetical protein